MEDEPPGDLARDLCGLDVTRRRECVRDARKCDVKMCLTHHAVVYGGFVRAQEVIDDTSLFRVKFMDQRDSQRTSGGGDGVHGGRHTGGSDLAHNGESNGRQIPRPKIPAPRSVSANDCGSAAGGGGGKTKGKKVSGGEATTNGGEGVSKPPAPKAIPAPKLVTAPKVAPPKPAAKEGVKATPTPTPTSESKSAPLPKVAPPKPTPKPVGPPPVPQLEKLTIGPKSASNEGTQAAPKPAGAYVPPGQRLAKEKK